MPALAEAVECGRCGDQMRFVEVDPFNGSQELGDQCVYRRRPCFCPHDDVEFKFGRATDQSARRGSHGFDETLCTLLVLEHGNDR